jgi:hypothetical protein
MRSGMSDRRVVVMGSYVSKLGRELLGDTSPQLYRTEGIDTRCLGSTDSATGAAAIIVDAARALKHDALRRYLTSPEERSASQIALLLLLAGHRNLSSPWAIEYIL